MKRMVTPVVIFIRRAAEKIVALHVLRRALSLSILATICALLAGACSENKGVELPTTIATLPPAPPPQMGNIAGIWKGTYNTNDDIDCDTSVALAAEATFTQHGSTVSGTIKATGPCGLDYTFQGTLQGNTLNGDLSTESGFFGTAHGTLSDKILEIMPFNSYSYNMGTMHLHR